MQVTAVQNKMIDKESLGWITFLSGEGQSQKTVVKLELKWFTHHTVLDIGQCFSRVETVALQIWSVVMLN